MSQANNAKKGPNTLRTWGTRLTAAVAGAGALYFGLADSKLDLLGDARHTRSSVEIKNLAQQKFDKLYARSNVAGRFALLYLQGDTAENYRGTIKIGQKKGGNGILGKLSAISASDPEYEYGQTCLNGSAYDTRPSLITGRAHGDISAVAALNVEDGVVVVFPAASDARPLRFNQDDRGLLSPSDSGTIATLSAYGCSPRGDSNVAVKQL